MNDSGVVALQDVSMAVHAGEAHRAVVLLEEARASLAGARNANEVIETDGILALARLHDGDVGGAEEAARGSLELTISPALKRSWVASVNSAARATAKSKARTGRQRLRNRLVGQLLRGALRLRAGLVQIPRGLGE